MQDVRYMETFLYVFKFALLTFSYGRELGLKHNGSVVWFVAVCPGVARFLPIPVDGAEVMCHGELCKLLCKNLDT